MSLAPGLPLSLSCVAVIFALFLFSASWLLCSFSCLLRQQLVGSVDLEPVGSKLFFGLVLHCNSASISYLRTLRIQVVTVTSPGGCNIQDIFSFSGFLAINLS